MQNALFLIVILDDIQMSADLLASIKQMNDTKIVL